MKISIYKCDNLELESDFNYYNDLVNKLFESSSDKEYDILYDKIIVQKNIIQKSIDKLIKISEVNEEFYDENITDEEAKMLFMNGIYSYEEIQVIINRFKNDISIKFINYIEDICLKNSNSKVLFWNY